jgi:hypothetical protein
MNALLAGGPITKSKLATTKINFPEAGFIRLRNIVAPLWADPVPKVLGGQALNQSGFRNLLS